MSCSQHLVVSAERSTGIKPPGFEDLPASGHTGRIRGTSMVAGLGVIGAHVLVLSLQVPAPDQEQPQPVWRTETILLLPPYVPAIPAVVDRTTPEYNRVADVPRSLEETPLMRRTISGGRPSVPGSDVPLNAGPLLASSSLASSRLVARNSADVYEPPQLLSRGRSRYPIELRAARVEGVVLIDFVVDTSGQADPESIVFLESNHPAFEEPARQVILKSVFRPAHVNGRRVKVPVRMTLTFSPGEN